MASFEGNCISLKSLEGLGSGVLELEINLKKESINKFNAETLAELNKALDQIPSDAKGVLVSSGKDTFVAGADITEFLDYFKKSEIELKTWIEVAQKTFNRLEDLNCPTVCTIAGFALGGGFEYALSCDYRIAAAGSKIGLPETKLGIIPGWGGTVKLPRLIGMDAAIEWITSGNQFDASDALKLGVIDSIVAPSDLRQAGLSLLGKLIQGELDFKARRKQKEAELPLNTTEKTMGFNIMKAGVFAVAGSNYPAPFAAIESIEKSQNLTRDQALSNEAAIFAKVAKSTQAKALVGTFLADQTVKKKAKALKSKASEVKQAAVLGAGIMGGGIAYQSAMSKIRIFMKDIKSEALAHGMKEAVGLLDKAVSRGKATPLSMAETLTRITPTLNIQDLKTANFVIEAVTENEKIKIGVLKETEEVLNPDAILTSNTSTISITNLASNLKRPEKFCGMHFFNPVPKMPLVEIIRGAKTSPETIATAVTYAVAMGKTPIVVNDCPGFLVNRVLFAYFTAFNQLVKEGVDFVRIDRVMEKWGWPMGPAYLLDVVGIDTGNHASAVMAKGFPDRMPLKDNDSVAQLYQAQRFGQKNGKGFYAYSVDAKGKPKKEVNPEVYSVLKINPQAFNAKVTDQEIMERLMLAFIFESARCLDEKIVDSKDDLDLAMLMGLGFPPFRGGPMRFAETLGAEMLIQKGSDYFKTLGKLYEVTPGIKEVLSHV